jgi:glycolate oxidase
VANVCHAGDGNIHPLILYDPDSSEEQQRAQSCSEEILTACIELGGSITGEHGVGVEKRGMLSRMFTDHDITHMRRMRDGLNPHSTLNPGKIFPDGGGCGEIRSASIPAGTWL